MKIVTLLGSPRTQGNSSAIVKTFLKKAEGLGAETKVFELNKLKYRGCQACMLCKTKLEKCALDDELTPVLDLIHGSDILVVSTPIYFADVSSQLKTFIDRCYSLLVPDFYNSSKPSRLAPGKKMVFIISQGSPDEKHFSEILLKYDFIFQLLGFKEVKFIRVCGLRDPDDIMKRADILTLAEETALELVL